MRHAYTLRWPAVILLLFLFGGQQTVKGQAGPPLGDDFIFFVDGTNTIVPTFAGDIVDDPLDPASGNKVLQMSYGNWAFNAFRFDQFEGVDLTQNQAAGDSLFVTFLSDPANAGQPNVTFTLTDKTDGSTADDGTADLEFRLQWFIPNSFHDGAWHTVGIPLPPDTWQGLEDWKAGGTLDSIANAWVYGGAWSGGGFPVALDGTGPNSADRPDLFQEFEWTNVYTLGVFFDNNTTGGPIYLDNVYIGNSDLDLSVANQPASAMSGVVFSANGAENMISWSPITGAGAYNVYVSETPFTAVSDAGVALLTSVQASAPALEAHHMYEVPHESFSPVSFYYAVTTLSGFGVENTDITNSSGTVANPDLPVEPSIIQLTSTEADQLFNDLSTGTASGAGFPASAPVFNLDASHSVLGDGATLPDNDDDNSGNFWVGYSDLNELWVYAEVKDDILELPGTDRPPSDAWQNDSIEMGWGNYDVRDAGGSIVTGSPHTDMMRGDFADYQFRISGHVDANGDIAASHAFVGYSLDADVPGGGAAVEKWDDGAGNIIGYKVLALIPLDQIQSVADGDAVLSPPTSTELRVVPFELTLNDADGSGRESQMVWSFNGTSQWWNTPANWAPVAMVGSAYVSTANEEPSELPNAYNLEQNYPNPFNPATSIRFTLPVSQNVTLEVFDLLGRNVATLLSDQPMEVGAHTVSFDASKLASGTYLYRLSAGGKFVQTKSMMLIK